jgi:hypothetical protein
MTFAPLIGGAGHELLEVLGDFLRELGHSHNEVAEFGIGAVVFCALVAVVVWLSKQ